MKHTAAHILSLIVLIGAMGLPAVAQRPAAAPAAPAAQPAQRQQPPQPQRERPAAPNAPAAGREIPQPLRPAVDQAKKVEQQRDRMANAVVDRYLGGFQKNVGLDDKQTRKFSTVLGKYVRRQIMLAQNRTEAIRRLQELSDQQASPKAIAAQNKALERTEAEQVNAEKRFYAEMNPQLTPQQFARLRLYLDSTGQSLRQAIQRSTQ